MIGHIYACYSRYCDWIKLGFSVDPQRRFRELNREHPNFAPFTPIGVTRGTLEAEQQIHRAMVPFRRLGWVGSYELYPASHSVVGVAKAIVANEVFWRINNGDMAVFERWAERAARHPLNRVIIRECFDRENQGAA